jgi:DNA-binding transcriptional ArsR family regulator
MLDMLSCVKRALDPDIKLLQAAADPTRLAILRQLSAESEVCACDFNSCCEVGQPTVSHHLRVLREAGWVESERRGTWVWYSIRPDAVARFHQLAGGLAPGPAQPVAALSGVAVPLAAERVPRA